jgi:uncharacterized membrane protein
LSSSCSLLIVVVIFVFFMFAARRRRRRRRRQVVVNGHTGEVIGDRPYGTGKIGELGKAGLSVVGDYLFKRGGSSS